MAARQDPAAVNTHGLRRDGLRWAVRQSLRKLYYRTPLAWRSVLLRYAFRLRPGWFRHHPRFQQSWLQQQGDAGLGLNLLSKQPLGSSQAPGRIAVHCHLFYPDLLAEFGRQLAVIPYPFDLYVSVPTEALALRCRQAFKDLGRVRQLQVAVVANRGRDIAPMLVTFGRALAKYDYIGHIQSKKSLYNAGATLGWRTYLLQSLLGSADNVKRIFGVFQREPDVGMIYPQVHAAVPYYAFSWLANRAQGAELCARLGIAMPAGYFDFPAGSMFWARASCLRPLFELGLRLEDFPPEQAQTDGTTAHALERVLGLLPAATGLRSWIIADEAQPSWSPLRIEQHYLSRSSASFARIEHDPSLRVIAFDIFDTLLVRPLLDPDHTKQLIALSLAPADAAVFTRYRVTAEAQARAQAGRDIGLTAIYQQIQQLSGADPLALARIRAAEEALEIASVAPRTEVVDLLRRAVAAGRRVILISDMFLERPVIEAMLAQHAIGGWQQLYLSSERGARKDSAELYRLMLAEEGIRGEQMLMIGDNERADLQIPVDVLGAQVLHLLKATDLAGMLPEFRHWLHQLQGLPAADVTASMRRELSAGLLLRRQLNKIADFEPADMRLFAGDAFQTGFNIVGPLLASFVAWLHAQAQRDSISELYFLAREGQLIKRVYDAWTEGLDAPRSHYLQVSRRAVNVPSIGGFEDVLAIAREVFHAGPASDFLYERFGLKLSAQRWADMDRQGVWRETKPLEVQAGDTRRIEPLLRELLPEMLAVAGHENIGLMHYLEQQGLNATSTAAVVDVGYSGTIQKALCRLLDKPLDGYYMATSASIRQGLPEAAAATGCFVDAGVPMFAGSRILTDSFELEKLLSSDDTQVCHYRLAEDGRLQQVCKPRSQQELQTQPLRAELQRGCMAFVAEAVAIRQQLYPDFVVPPEVADALYSGLIQSHLAEPAGITSQLVLDDDYCGRGLIS